jgi:hypothetical protein
MRTKHQDLFAKFSETFKPETMKKWEAMVKAWEAVPTRPNPYEEPVNSKHMYTQVGLSCADDQH